MRYLFVAYIVLALTGCQVDYEDNERLLIQGRVNDNAANPIPDLTITIYASNGGGVYGSTHPIGVGKTLSDGSFGVVTLSPKTPSNLRITVNENLRQGYRPEYFSETIDEVELFDIRNYTYVLPVITLNKTTVESKSHGFED